MEEYEVKGKTASIKATSRASVTVKLKNGNTNYYTVEYCEERVIPDLPDVDITKEREALWAAVNTECDNQVESILRTFT